MSKPILLALGFLLLGFVTGIGAGLFMGGASPASDGSTKANESYSSGFFSSPEVQNQVQANTELCSRIRDLEKELAEQKQNQQTSLVERMAFFKKYHDQLRLTALNGDTRVSDEMAEILGLSKEERQTVEQRLKETSDAINKIDNANEFVAKQDANGFTIETPADPQGKAQKDALANSLSADLGSDRAAFLMSYMEDSSSAPFGGFAQAKKDLDITWANQDGKLLYTIKNQFYDPKGQGNSASWYTSPTLPAEYQKYVQTDPAPGP
jgi:hypothetical protein